MLVRVDEDDKMFGGKAKQINKIQNIEIAKISGREYYRIKCTITEGNRDLLVRGIQNKQYPMPRFKSLEIGKGRLSNQV